MKKFKMTKTEIRDVLKAHGISVPQLKCIEIYDRFSTNTVYFSFYPLKPRNWENIDFSLIRDFEIRRDYRGNLHLIEEIYVDEDYRDFVEIP